MMGPAKVRPVQVFVLPTGYLYLPDYWIFANGDATVSHLSPDYSFLVCHSSGENVLFDLGLRKDIKNFPTIVKADFDVLQLYVPRDARDLLSRGPIKPTMIDKIILSHLHFDHVGDITRFPNTPILLGPGSLGVTSPGYPESPDSPFDSNFFKHKHVAEFSESQYQSFKEDTVPKDFPFTSGVDVFGDGSFYILDAPGHMQGHQMAIARTAKDEWVIMGGDCCHHREFLEEHSRDVGMVAGPAGHPGMHKHPTTARTTIAKMKQMHQSPDILALLAHDAYLEGVIPLYPEPINGWREAGLKTATRESPLYFDEVQERHGRRSGFKSFMKLLCCFPLPSFNFGIRRKKYVQI